MPGFDETKLNAAINAAHEELDIAVAEMERAGRQVSRGAKSERQAALRNLKAGPERINAAWRKILLSSWSYNAALAEHVGVRDLKRPDIGSFMRLPKLTLPNAHNTQPARDKASHDFARRKDLFYKLEEELFDQQVELGMLLCEREARDAERAGE